MTWTCSRMRIIPLPHIKSVVPVVTTERLNATMFAHVSGGRIREPSSMRKTRKRKLPVTTAAEGRGSASSHPHSTRTLIRRFHVLLKRRAALLASGDAESLQLVEVEQEIENLGGLSAYQRMSVIGQASDRGGGSEKRLIAWLKEIGLSDGSQKLRYVKTSMWSSLSDERAANETFADCWKSVRSSRITTGRVCRGST